MAADPLCAGFDAVTEARVREAKGRARRLEARIDPRDASVLHATWLPLVVNPAHGSGPVSADAEPMLKLPPATRLVVLASPSFGAPEVKAKEPSVSS